MKIEVGKEYRFQTMDSGLKQYNGSSVKVLRPLTDEECDRADVGNMYKVLFPDGLVKDVFEDELSLPGKTSVYYVPFAYERYGRIKVEAASPAEAWEKAEQKLDQMGEQEMEALSEYLMDSAEIDEDGTLEDEHRRPVEE